MLAALDAIDATISDREQLLTDLKPHVGKLKPTELKLLQKHLGEHDEEAAYCLTKGEREVNPDLRDTENVPLGEDVDDYFAREVTPHVPDAWIDESKCDARDGQVGVVGYEIPFNRHFYVYTPPRPLEEIDADLARVSREIVGVVGGGGGVNSTRSDLTIYVETGHAHIREIPSSWEVTRFKFLFRRASRGFNSKDGTVTAFRDGQVTLRSNRRTTGFTESFKEIGYQGVKLGDLVVHAMDAFAGAIGVSDSDGKCTPVYSVCIPEKDASARYFGAFLRSVAINGFVESLAKGVRERSTEFRYSELKEVWLPSPSYVEQLRIIAFLDTETARIDTLIDKQKKLIELLKEKRQAVISQAVTKGLDPDVPMKDSGVEWLGEVPAHWVVKSYRHASKIYRGKFGHRPRNDPSLYGGDFAFIQTGDVARAKNCIESYTQTLNSKGAAVSQLFPAGTLVMAIAANIGDTAILQFAAYAPDSVVGFRPISQVSLEYLKYSLEAALPALEQSSTQSAQANLNIERIGAVKAVFPDLPMQIEIAAKLDDVLSKMDLIHTQCESAIVLLQERRTALITAAVTGQIDVTNYSPNATSIQPAEALQQGAQP